MEIPMLGENQSLRASHGLDRFSKGGWVLYTAASSVKQYGGISYPRYVTNYGVAKA